MKIVESYIIPEHKSNKIKEIICDICKNYSNGDTWPIIDDNNILETTVEIKEGVSFGTEGGNITKINFDICPKCFKEKLIPFIKAFGNKPNIEEISW
jgi:hypothetical protein